MYVAVDIGGTKTLIAAFSEDGQILRSEKQPTKRDFSAFITEVIETINRVADGEPVESIAVASPALIDDDTKINKAFGNLDWKNVDIVGPLQDAITDQVFIENDAKMGALGEANMGAGQGHETVLYITLSTGIGAGVTVNGELSPALRHMESGSMILNDHSNVTWEQTASGKAFYQEFGMKGEDDTNPDHWKQWAEDVALGMYDLIAIIQPDAVIIGGSMGNHIQKYQDYLHAAIQAKRNAMVDMPVIVGAKDPDNAVINGCYVVCKQHSQK